MSELTAPGFVDVFMGRVLQIVVQSVEGVRERWGRTRVRAR
jgi:hypothetical protein